MNISKVVLMTMMRYLKIRRIIDVDQVDESNINSNTHSMHTTQQHPMRYALSASFCWKNTNNDSNDNKSYLNSRSNNARPSFWSALELWGLPEDIRV
jgi:hypothetical protein